MMRLIVCAAQANDVSHTHPPLYPTLHPLPNQQIWLQLAGGEDEAACAAQLGKTLNNLLNRWQCALIPQSAHSRHCLRKRKQHHTSLRFNWPATLFKRYLDHMPHRWGFRNQKKFGQSGQESSWTMILLSLGRLTLVFVVSVVWMDASTFKVRKILKTRGRVQLRCQLNLRWYPCSVDTWPTRLREQMNFIRYKD